MPYQQPSAPRFYVNILEWLELVGSHMLPTLIIQDYQVRVPQDTYRTLPVIPKFHTYESVDLFLDAGTGEALNPPFQFINPFIAVLGHELTSNFWSDDLYGADIEFHEIVNKSPETSFSWGFSIVRCSIDGNPATPIKFGLGSDADIGSVIIGSYYDMPHSPNLTLNMNYEYGKENEYTALDGSTFSNQMWNKPPMWGNLPAWELQDSRVSGIYSKPFSRSGRKTYDLTFSYLNDGDLWGSNQLLISNYQEVQDSSLYDNDGSLYNSDLTSQNKLQYNIVSDNSFFSQVWHMTGNGTLPFIFQPDKNDFTNFSICRFRNNSLKATQVSSQLYDISVSLEEVW